MKQIGLFVTFLVLLCFSGSLSFSIPATSIEISLQSLLVVLPAFYLPTLLSVLVVVLYLALGALGLPVFSGGASGVMVLFGPHLGFFIGFALANYGLSNFNALSVRTFQQSFLYLIVGQLLLLLMGFGYLAFIQSEFSMVYKAVYFLPGLLIKSVVGSVVVFFSKKNIN